MKVHRSVGHNEIYMQVLRELTDQVAKPLSFIFEKLWQFSDGKLELCFYKVKKEDPGNCKLGTLPSVPGKIKEHILLETIQRLMESKEVIGDNHHGFTRGKLCLTSFVAFYSGFTALVFKEGVTDAIYPDLGKAFDIGSKFERHGFSGWNNSVYKKLARRLYPKY